MKRDHYLEELRRIAEAAGGKLLSTEWKGSQAKYRFAFADGREFEMSGLKLRQRGWPSDPDSYLRRSALRGDIHIAEMLRIVESHGARLLATEWKGFKARYCVTLSDGRQFWPTGATIKRDAWPADIEAYLRSHSNPYRGDIHLPRLRQLAELRGGHLLSEEWRGTKALYLFADQAGLLFQTSGESIFAGKWTPYAGLIAEPVCRQAMEHLFRAEFPKTRRILKRKGKHPLELDGYAERVVCQGQKYKVAFEYQGDPSHQQNPIVLARDIEKRQLCQQQNVIMVIIERLRAWNPYDASYILRHVRQAIGVAFQAASMAVPPLNEDGFTVQFPQIHDAVQRLRVLKKLAAKNGGQCISTAYKGHASKHEFAFADGRRFATTPSVLLSHGWPTDPDTYFRSHANPNRGELHLADQQRIAEENGGRLVSEKWMGAKYKYRFAHADGREFSVSPGNLRQGGWPQDIDLHLRLCRSTKDHTHLNKMGEIAASNGACLLNEDWKGAMEKYEFVLSDGSILAIPYETLRERGWPTALSTFKKKSRNKAAVPESCITELRQIAQVNGGLLISTEWHGVRAKYLFAWPDGRTFEKSAARLHSDGWPTDQEGYLRGSANADRGAIHLAEMLQIAEANGGKLLSTEWRGSQAKYRFSFADSREFDITHNKLVGRGWPKNPNRYFKHIETLAKKQTHEARS